MLAQRTRILGASDLVLSLFCGAVGYVAAFERLDLPAPHLAGVSTYLLGALVVRAVVLWLGGAYRPVWRYASLREALSLVVAGSVSALGSLLIGRLLPMVGLPAVPWSALLLDAALFMGGIVGIRLAVRAARTRLGRPARTRGKAGGRRTLIIGAGSAGRLVARELVEGSGSGLHAVGFLDDDVSLHGKHIHGLPVLGPIATLPEAARAEDVDLAVIAVPSASGVFVREVLQLSRDAGVDTRTIPGIDEILSGRVAISSLRQVQIEDLLRRKPVTVDLAALRSGLGGRTVLVTGAGGSIGSELCRQLASLGPSHLVLLGHGENSIFEVHQELRDRFPEVSIVPVIADIKDEERIQRICRDWRPFAVFHAAAHKHVPLMEDNVIEAVLNNVVGTRNVVQAALAVGVQHFVLVSTDKAVRPTNVMGATKRVAEMIVSHVAHTHGVKYAAVRFGNVLGSRGSVVPTFLRQIRNGGPITLTHPEMRRYFMTIPEAVRLVLQAAAIGRGGEVFCLDMGDPVRIYDLACDLIRLSGLTEGEDIEIVFSGIRPGEKLYEELFFAGDDVQRTEHDKIVKARYEAPDLRVYMRIVELIESATRNASDAYLRRYLEEIVPDYVPAGREDTARLPMRDVAPPLPAVAAGAERG